MRNDTEVSPKAVIGGLVFAVLLIGLVMSKPFHVVSTGNVGVQAMFGSVRSECLPEGFNLVNPLVQVTDVSVQLQKHHASYLAASKDMQRVHVDMILNYQLDPSRAAEVFQKIGPDYAGIIIDPAAQETLKSITAKHQAAEILHERASIKAEVEKNLSTWLNKYGILLKEASLSEIKFDPAYEQAIEQKQIQEQVAQRKEYELQQAQKQAQIVAAAADGEAQALKIKGAAEADYNAKVSSSLSPRLLQQLYLQKWDGHLPRFVNGGSGNGGGMLFQIDPLKDETK
jgi:regulator of protease activity HflC (stomatin/prohibitin superfamily)